MVNIIEKIAPANSKCRPGYQRTGFLGVTIHNTGNPVKGAGARNHAAYLSGDGQKNQVSYHYVIDDKDIYKCIPENEVAWHAGDGAGSGNYKTIAIEICMNPDSDLLVATNNAAELAADTLKRNGITTVQGHLFQHNHWSGKNCPSEIRAGRPYDWTAFMSKVQDFLIGTTAPAPTAPPSNSFTANGVVNMRDSGETKALTYQTETTLSSFGWVPKSERVQIVETGKTPVNGYIRYKIKYALIAGGYKEGWINSRWIDRDGQTSAPAAPQSVFLTVSTNSSPLALNKLFNGKEALKPILIWMPKGAKVELLEKSNNKWYKVKYNGIIGWASSEYLK